MNKSLISDRIRSRMSLRIFEWVSEWVMLVICEVFQWYFESICGDLYIGVSMKMFRVFGKGRVGFEIGNYETLCS